MPSAAATSPDTPRPTEFPTFAFAKNKKKKTRGTSSSLNLAHDPRGIRVSLRLLRTQAAASTIPVEKKWRNCYRNTRAAVRFDGSRARVSVGIRWTVKTGRARRERGDVGEEANKRETSKVAAQRVERRVPRSNCIRKTFEISYRTMRYLAGSREPAVKMLHGSHGVCLVRGFHPAVSVIPVGTGKKPNHEPLVVSRYRGHTKNEGEREIERRRRRAMRVS